MRHKIERALVGVMLLTSFVFAGRGKWQEASYFLFLGAFVDFEDWTGRVG